MTDTPSDLVQPEHPHTEGEELSVGDEFVPDDGQDDTQVDVADEALTVEELLDDLVKVTAERDAHLADLQRVGADFANFRKRVDKRHGDEVAQAASKLVDRLLPVLDACDAAILQGAADVEPIRSSLLEVLTKEGLEVIADIDQPFDPEVHEAVLFEEGDGAQTVGEIMRTGYGWKGRVLRPAMVKVRG